MSFDDVHTPWVPDEEQQSIFPKGSWDEASLEKVLHEYDILIGRLIKGLQKLGMYKNTIGILPVIMGLIRPFRENVRDM